MKSAVIFTYIPSPYRTIVFDKLFQHYPNTLQVVYMSKGDDKFRWNTNSLKHDHLFLTDITATRNPLLKGWSIWKYLNQLNPGAVITCGFTLPMLYVMLWAFVKRKKRIVNTDAWIKIEEPYSYFHKLIRKCIYPSAHAVIPVSQKGKQMFQSYGIKEERIFISHYAIDNDRSKQYWESTKTYHLMFSGQMIDRKMPLFFCDVVSTLKKEFPELKILILGSGVLKNDFIDRLKKDQIDFHYPGFVQPEELPEYYGSARLFLFPTMSDSWGVVANDAMAAGTPVITCANAGCSNELVLDEVSGWVRPLIVEEWVSVLRKCLLDSEYYSQIREKAMQRVQDYHPQIAAEQLKRVIDFVLTESPK
jgi:glycosyltransferase involved in cell wall biosynthesis